MTSLELYDPGFNDGTPRAKFAPGDFVYVLKDDFLHGPYKINTRSYDKDEKEWCYFLEVDQGQAFWFESDLRRSAKS